MQVNTEKWGNSSQWQIDTNVYPASGIRDSNYAFYNGKRLTMGDYIAGGEMAYNTPIDTTICYAAHASDTKMPLADIALIGNKDGSVIATQTKDCGWFLGSQNTASRGDWQTFCNVEAIKNGTPTQQITTARAFLWSPNGTRTGYWVHDNNHEILKPIVKFNLRSFFGVVRVILITNDHKTQTSVTLKALKDNINTYKNTHYIGSVYMSMRCYQGGDSANGFTNFNYCNVNNFGCGIIKPFKINNSNNEILSYYQTINGYGQLPIANIPYPERLQDNYGNYVYGVGAYTHTTSTTSSYREVSYPVYMYHLIDRIDIVSGSYDSTILCPVIPITAETVDELYKGAAAYGVFFSDDFYTLQTDTTNTARYFNNNMMLGVLDENGVGHGEYTRGLDNINNPVFQWSDSTQSPYNPSIPPTPTDPNTYSVTTGFNTVGNVASTTKAYVVNAASLTGLSGEMWNIINNLVTTPDDMTNLDNLTLDAFLTNNPIDAIVSVKKFPLSSVPHAENLENIYLGKYQAGAAGYALALQQARYNFEGIPIFPKFGNCFLDYAPYTKMQLYVPFCGTIDIDAADFMGRTLSVEMVIDFITGAVTAYVLANQLVVTSLTGTCAIDIPITGTEQSTVSASLENAILQDKSARGNYTLKGSAGGMLTNPIGNITHPTTAIENRFSTKLQKMQANYNLQHIEMPLRQIGNASPLNSWALEFVCRLIIYYPDGECITFNATNEPSLITDKVKSFGAVNGFATVETNTLSSFTGFTQVSDADLSGVSATDTEKEMILSLLQSGVYL